MKKIALCRFSIFALLWPLTAVAVDTGHVAGLAPSVRPPDAPVIRAFEPAEGWMQHALRGIPAPHTGLGFLKDQGAW
jgi:hypothetical protein